MLLRLSIEYILPFIPVTMYFISHRTKLSSYAQYATLLFFFATIFIEYIAKNWFILCIVTIFLADYIFCMLKPKKK